MEAHIAHGPRPGGRIWTLKVCLLLVGPTAVGVPAALCIFFRVSPAYDYYATFVLPPTVLYLWVALVYWFGYRKLNQADKLATLTATTGLYLLSFPLFGFIAVGPQDRVLALLTLLTIATGAFEIRRWKRRLSYLPLGGLLAFLGVTWLMGRLRGPAILYLFPGLLLWQSLILIGLCLPAELYRGGAGDPPEPRGTGFG